MRKIFLMLLLCISFAQAQETVSGKVLDEQNLPLPGAGVNWLNTTISASTLGDGTFTIPYSSENKKLVISYLGYVSDTLDIASPKYITHKMKPAKGSELKEVVLDKTRKSLERSQVKAANVSNMGIKELLKAACCNIA